jgi:heptaprenylglyceryl phosphate synthase
MDDLRDYLEQLKDSRLDYVMARSKCNSDSEAYRQAGISKPVFYRWLPEEREKLNDLAQRVKRETATRALMVLQDAAEQAALVKTKGLESRDERVKQAVATEILDRTVGKPATSLEVSGKNGEKIQVEVVYTQNSVSPAGLPSEPTRDQE